MSTMRCTSRPDQQASTMPTTPPFGFGRQRGNTTRDRKKKKTKKNPPTLQCLSYFTPDVSSAPVSMPKAGGMVTRERPTTTTRRHLGEDSNSPTSCFPIAPVAPVTTAIRPASVCLKNHGSRSACVCVCRQPQEQQQPLVHQQPTHHGWAGVCWVNSSVFHRSRKFPIIFQKYLVYNSGTLIEALPEQPCLCGPISLPTSCECSRRPPGKKHLRCFSPMDG